MKGDPVEEVLLMRVRWTPEWKITVLIYSSLCECEQGRGFTTVDDLSVRTEGRKKSRERGQFVFFLQEKDKLSATKTHKLLIRTSQIECQVEQLGFGIKFSQKGEVGASLHWQSGTNKERRIINGTLICFFLDKVAMSDGWKAAMGCRVGPKRRKTRAVKASVQPLETASKQSKFGWLWLEKGGLGLRCCWLHVTGWWRLWVVSV